MAISQRLSVAFGTAAMIASLALAAPAAAGGDCNGGYVVSAGDTLSSIAARCGSSVAALMEANTRITSRARIAVGWRLTIPGVGVEGDREVPVGAVPPGGTAGPAAAGQPVALTGRIVNGRRCAMIETADGRSWGVVSPELAFISGAVVQVTGQVVDDPSCGGPRTLLVDQLISAAPT